VLISSLMTISGALALRTSDSRFSFSLFCHCLEVVESKKRVLFSDLKMLQRIVDPWCCC
jgi:hypothetical protein